MATVSPTGELHVVPVTFRYNPEHESIDIGGENLVQTKKYRDAVRRGRVAFVVDDVPSPGHMQMVEVHGAVEGLPVGGKEMMEYFAPKILRITPTRIISFGLSSAGPRLGRRGRRFSVAGWDKRCLISSKPRFIWAAF